MKQSDAERPELLEAESVEEIVRERLQRSEEDKKNASTWLVVKQRVLHGKRQS